MSREFHAVPTGVPANVPTDLPDSRHRMTTLIAAGAWLLKQPRVAAKLAAKWTDSSGPW